MSYINYEDFHQFIIRGQKQNKKNPGKFGTIEMYLKLIDGFFLEILQQKEKGKNPEEILNYLEDLINKETKKVYKNL